jgi:hypothetical protein
MATVLLINMGIVGVHDYTNYHAIKPCIILAD